MRTRAKPRYHFHAELSPELEQLRRELEQETGYSASRLIAEALRHFGGLVLAKQPGHQPDAAA